MDGGYKGIHTFAKGISLKENVMAQLEFKLTKMSQYSTLATMPERLPQRVE